MLRLQSLFQTLLPLRLIVMCFRPLYIWPYTNLKICTRGRIRHSLTPFFLGRGLAVTLICEAAENSYGSLMEIESAFAVIEVNSMVKSSDGNWAKGKKVNWKFKVLDSLSIDSFSTIYGLKRTCKNLASSCKILYFAGFCKILQDLERLSKTFAQDQKSWKSKISKISPTHVKTVLISFLFLSLKYCPYYLKYLTHCSRTVLKVIISHNDGDWSWGFICLPDVT